MAFAILTHAIRMLWNNLGNAAKISVVPAIFALLAIAAIAALIGLPVATLLEGSNETSAYVTGSGLLFVGGIGIFVVYLLGFSWVAVSWHRFILLEEYPQGWVPKWNGPEIWSYFGRFMLLGIAGIALMVPAVLLFSVLIGAGSIGGEGFAAFLAFVGVVLAVPVAVWIGFRWSLILPAAAVGQQMGIGDSWRATSDYSRMIFIFSLIYLAFSFAVQLVAAGLGFVPVLGAIASFVIGWFTTILGFSCLTTIYGVAVEGRKVAG